MHGGCPLPARVRNREYLIVMLFLNDIPRVLEQFGLPMEERICFLCLASESKKG